VSERSLKLALPVTTTATRWLLVLAVDSNLVLLLHAGVSEPSLKLALPVTTTATRWLLVLAVDSNLVLLLHAGVSEPSLKLALLVTTTATRWLAVTPRSSAAAVTMMTMRMRRLFRRTCWRRAGAWRSMNALTGSQVRPW
jgi:hypothetical protein